LGVGIYAGHATQSESARYGPLVGLSMRGSMCGEWRDHTQTAAYQLSQPL